MLANPALRKALNQAAFALSQREFARFRAELEQELEHAEAHGATQRELFEMLSRRVYGPNGGN